MKIVRWTKFKKDFKKYIKDENLIKEFEKVIKTLISKEKLEEKYLDHKLKWRYSNFRECHIKPNLLLVYEIKDNELTLYLFRLWSHSEIF